MDRQIGPAGQLLVLYVHVTLGHAHRARIHALDRQPGMRCRGVQLAERELTRGAEALGDFEDQADTLLAGIYEHHPRRTVISSAVRYIRSQAATAVIFDGPADAAQYLIGWLLQRSGIAVFVRWASTREDYPRKVWKEFLKRPIYSRWDGYLATGTRAQSYLETFGVEPRRVFVCGNPVDTGAVWSARPAVLAEREPRFLFVGRFIWHKNLPGLLDAYERYRAQGGTWELDLAGAPIGSLGSLVTERARSLPGVRVLGHLQKTEIAALYWRAGCLVLPSLSENWGLVVNEAMNAELPLIVSERCGCVPELVRSGENGFVVDPANPAELAWAMARIEELGPDARAAMGARSQQLVAPQSLERWAVCAREALLQGLAGRR